MRKPSRKSTYRNNASANAEMGASATNEATCTGSSPFSNNQFASDTDHAINTPRTVIRGESPTGERKKSQAALTDWLNVSFPFNPENNSPLDFFKSFTETTKDIFGGMTDQQRGLHGWMHSFKFDRGCTLFAYGGQNKTAFLSLPGEGCALIFDWQSFTSYLKNHLQARITRWDGAVDDFYGAHSVDMVIEFYKQGHFKHGGREPKLTQHGNWIKPDGSGRSVYVGNRKNGKLIRIYEKGKQLGDPSSPWVRWEVEFHAKDRVIPWEVLLHLGEYVAGAYPCLSWVSERVFRINTIKEQDRISYERLKQVASTAYGALFNVMLQREGSAELIVEQLKRHAIPRRLAATDHYLRTKGKSDEI
ncbi:MAG: replication initiation factor domain-containing protein [Nitrosomonas sp.]|nr:replication initiation factor domain-containing protein [Nitrosomonas sp.]